MAIVTLDDVTAAIQQQALTILKPSVTTEGAGFYQSLWKSVGAPVTLVGANPPLFTAGSNYSPTRATTGAIPITNPGAGEELHILQAEGRSTVLGTLIIADRLWACSGFNTTTLTAQNITTFGTLPSGRDPYTGADVEPWLEVYTAPGATAATWTLNGTDANGNANRTWTYAHPANAETIGQMMPMYPGGGSPATSTGIEVANSLTCSGSSGTAGDVGITLIRRLAEIPLEVGKTNVLDWAMLGKPEVLTDACLMFIVLCTATSTGNIYGRLNLGAK